MGLAMSKRLLASRKARVAVVLAVLLLLVALVSWLVYSPSPRIALIRVSGKVQGTHAAVFRITNPSARAYSFYLLETNSVSIRVSTWAGSSWGPDRQQRFRVAGSPAWLPGGEGNKVLPPHSSFEIEGALPAGTEGTAIVGMVLSRGTEEEALRRFAALSNRRPSVDKVRRWLEVHGVGRPGAFAGEMLGIEWVWSEPFEVSTVNS
jgi:hypothetical protein